MNVSRRIVATFLAIAIVGLAGCTEEGQALPPGGNPTQPPGTSQSSGQLASVKACDLLTNDEAATISKGLASEDTGAGSGATSGCTWRTSIDRGVPPEEGVTFGIDIRPNQSVDEVSARGGAQVTDGDVSGRNAKQVAENDGIKGSCLLTFAAEQGRVDVIVERIDRPTAESCEIASNVSTIIEPKLPK